MSPETKGETVIDIDEMLDKLHSSIKKIYCEALEIPKEVDLSQKGSLEMLNVSKTQHPNVITFYVQAIEAHALKYIEEMKEYAVSDNSHLY